ncbi:MAG: FliH/SctL family protein, partial [Candidatus Eremiobacteraeota bacterium]|nr:FliH/SctL family protein [Candidatus Eremiobacteraeota bacterium]
IEDAAARADTIAQDARRGGHDEGFEAGRAAADAEMNDMLVTMRGLLEMARVERHKLIDEAEPELVRLALGIAERVLHQNVALDRGVVVEMAKTAIARLIERDSVTVRVNPADLERMREHRDELMALGDIRNLRLLEDKRVDRGGVVVETDAGTIDARIGTQLDEARKILHIEDDVIVEPAPAEVRMKSDLTAARASRSRICWLRSVIVCCCPANVSGRASAPPVVAVVAHTGWSGPLAMKRCDGGHENAATSRAMTASGSTKRAGWGRDLR